MIQMAAQSTTVGSTPGRNACRVPGHPHAAAVGPGRWDAGRDIDAPGDFSGLLRVSSVFDVSVTALRVRINELGELKVTTTQPSNETAAATSEDRFFRPFC